MNKNNPDYILMDFIIIVELLLEINIIYILVI